MALSRLVAATVIALSLVGTEAGRDGKRSVKAGGKVVQSAVIDEHGKVQHDGDTDKKEEVATDEITNLNELLDATAALDVDASEEKGAIASRAAYKGIDMYDGSVLVDVDSLYTGINGEQLSSGLGRVVARLGADLVEWIDADVELVVNHPQERYEVSSYANFKEEALFRGFGVLDLDTAEWSGQTSIDIDTGSALDEFLVANAELLIDQRAESGVLTSKASLQTEDVYDFTLSSQLDVAKRMGEATVYVLGGPTLYEVLDASLEVALEPKKEKGTVSSVAAFKSAQVYDGTVTVDLETAAYSGKVEGEVTIGDDNVDVVGADPANNDEESDADSAAPRYVTFSNGPVTNVRIVAAAGVSMSFGAISLGMFLLEKRRQKKTLSPKLGRWQVQAWDEASSKKPASGLASHEEMEAALRPWSKGENDVGFHLV